MIVAIITVPTYLGELCLTEKNDDATAPHLTLASADGSRADDLLMTLSGRWGKPSTTDDHLGDYEYRVLFSRRTQAQRRRWAGDMRYSHLFTQCQCVKKKKKTRRGIPFTNGRLRFCETLIHLPCSLLASNTRWGGSSSPIPRPEPLAVNRRDPIHHNPFSLSSTHTMIPTTSVGTCFLGWLARV